MSTAGEVVTLPSGNVARLRRSVDLAEILARRDASTSLLRALKRWFGLPLQTRDAGAERLLRIAAAFVEPRATTSAKHSGGRVGADEVQVYELADADLTFLWEWIEAAE